MTSLLLILYFLGAALGAVAGWNVARGLLVLEALSGTARSSYLWLFVGAAVGGFGWPIIWPLVGIVLMILFMLKAD